MKNLINQGWEPTDCHRSYGISLTTHSSLYPLLGRTRSRGRCWAAIQLSHHREPSGRAVHEEVGGLDIGGRHGRRFVYLPHTYRPQRRTYPICTSRSGNDNFLGKKPLNPQKCASSHTWKAADIVFVVLSFSFQVWRYWSTNTAPAFFLAEKLAIPTLFDKAK